MTRRPFPTVAKTIGRDTIADYAEWTGDYNPLHVDEEYARASPFGTIIAHGPLGLQTFVEAAAQWCGGRLPPGASVEVSFRAPVLADDVVTCTATETREHAATVVVLATCGNQRGQEVLQVLLAVPRQAAPTGAPSPSP